MLSNADDKVISTSGADDRFEVVPQVFVGSDGVQYDESDCLSKRMVTRIMQRSSFGQNVIVDLASRDDSAAGDGSSGDQWFAD